MGLRCKTEIIPEMTARRLITLAARCFYLMMTAALIAYGRRRPAARIR